MAVPGFRIVRIWGLIVDNWRAVVISYVVGIHSVIADDFTDIVRAGVGDRAVSALLDVSGSAIDGTVVGRKSTVRASS